MQRSPVRVSLSVLVIPVLATALWGCLSVPAVPAGPIRAPGVRLGLAYAYAHAAAETQATLPSGEPYGFSGNSQIYRAWLPVPTRVMLRYSPASFIDFGGDLALMDMGLQLRAGPLDAHRRIPWGFELEWRIGQAYRDSLPERARMYRARFEMYPRLGKLGAVDGFGVLTLGASTGTWRHYVSSPGHAGQSEGYDLPALNVLRPETRLEMSIGGHLLGGRAAMTLAFLPWIVVDEQRALKACADCGLQYRELDVDWGFAIAISTSWLPSTNSDAAP